VLTTAGSANLGGVSKFATIDLAAGNSTVTVTNTTLSGGAVTLNDGRAATTPSARRATRRPAPARP
jgi:nitrogen fixation protein